jgi:hypothetical protein
LETTEFQLFNPYDDIRFTANRLPHWQQKGALYFVTFRLADSVPQHLRKQWESDREAWLRFYPPPWDAEIERAYHQRFSGAIERWLDAGHGSCVLRRNECAAVVAQALRHFDLRAQSGLVIGEDYSELEGFHGAQNQFVAAAQRQFLAA